MKDLTRIEPEPEVIQKKSDLDSNDKDHLEWIHNRLEQVYGVPHNTDFMVRLRKIIDKI